MLDRPALPLFFWPVPCAQMIGRVGPVSGVGSAPLRQLLTAAEQLLAVHDCLPLTSPPRACYNTAGVMIMIFRFFRRWLRSRRRFQVDYDSAQLRDLEYAAAHPGCSLEEAHRERDRVLWDYGF